MQGRIISPIENPAFEGRVLGNLCRRFFIGNGIAGMIRKSALEAIGGFDEATSGHADSQVYLKLAERFKFACTRKVSVGYRLVPGSGVDRTTEFLDSFHYVTAPFRARYPEYAPLFEIQEKELIQWCCSRALHGRRFRDAAALLLKLAKLNPAFAAYSAAFVMIRPFLMEFRRRSSQMPERFEAIYSAPKTS